MSNRTFLLVLIVVAALVAAMVYIHRPRSAAPARSVGIHGAR
jgi:hypothetical protein